MRIDAVSAKAIADTRGKPTVEVTLSANTFTATASVPSGKSTGSHEAKELRDADGGVATAVANVNGEIAHALVGQRFASLDELDDALIALDGTSDKSRLGANAILGVSIAAQRLSALLKEEPLWKAIAERAGTPPAGGSRAPRLFVNVMNGGAHADFKLPFQEYLLVAEGPTSEALPLAQELFAKLGEQLRNVDKSDLSSWTSLTCPLGDEGGYAPTFDTLEEPFELLLELIAKHSSMSIALDAAATELRKDGGYELIGTRYSPAELTALYGKLAEKYRLHSIEDPFAEDALDDFARLTTALNSPSTSLGATTILVVGDDLTVTNPEHIEAARVAGAINAVLIKPNQIGTVKEAIEAVRLTRTNGWAVICSHRSGETMDTFIADFAYGVGAHGIKAGGFGQKERLAKYERLLAIEREALV